jgi:ribosomal protein S18 acetylase RimI-like enzyme
LQQTKPELELDFQRMTFLKALVNGKIIGSIRGYAEGSTAHVLRLVVHPYFRGRGVGSRLISEIETTFPPEVTRFEAFTGHKSKRNLYVYGKLGYQVFKTQTFTPAIEWIYMQKDRP